LLFQGVIRDEGDLNMLGGDFKNAYKARQIDLTLISKFKFAKQKTVK
jgi:hypothetical protein